MAKVVDWPERPVGRSDPGASMDRLERVFLDRLDHLYAFLRARLRDDALAEDVCQQVFLKACLARGTFRGDDGAMVGWLFRIARNEAISLQRRRSRERSWDAMGPAAPQPVDPEASPEARALASERQTELGALLARLSPAQLELLELHYAAGLTLVQIAALLGITDVAARQRLRRTLAQLRGEIDDPTTI